MQSTKTPQNKLEHLAFLKKSYRALHHFYLRYLYKRDTIFATFSVFIVIGLLAITIRFFAQEIELSNKEYEELQDKLRIQTATNIEIREERI